MSDTFVVFGSVTVMLTLSLYIAFYFRSRNRRTVYETVKLLTERGDPISPELIEALVQDKPRPKADLRRGVLFLAVALAVCLFSLAVGDGDAVGPLLGIASFPGLIGLAYIGLHVFTGEGKST
jgi:hypothetical protein